MGLAAMLSAPPLLGAQSGGASYKANRKPPRLRIGDTVGLIEPASASDEPFQIQLVEEAIVLAHEPSLRLHRTSAGA